MEINSYRVKEYTFGNYKKLNDKLCDLVGDEFSYKADDMASIHIDYRNEINHLTFPTNFCRVEIKLRSKVDECVEWKKNCPNYDYVNDVFTGFIIFSRQGEKLIGTMFYLDGHVFLPFGNMYIENKYMDLTIFDFTPEQRCRVGTFGKPNVEYTHFYPQNATKNEIDKILDHCYAYANDSYYDDINIFFNAFPSKKFKKRSIEPQDGVKFTQYDLY